MNQVLSENERLLAQAIDHDIVKTVVNLSVNDGCETVNECQKCLELKTELLNKKDVFEKETYDKLCCPNRPLLLLSHLARPGIVEVIPKLKFEKDHTYVLQCALRKKFQRNPTNPNLRNTIKKNSFVAYEICMVPMRVWCQWKEVHPRYCRMTTLDLQGHLAKPHFQHHCTPIRSDWDLCFNQWIDESLNPPPYVDLQAPEVIAPIPEVVAPEHAVLTGSPSSTTVDQDAPSPSNSHTTQETQTPIISHNVEEDNHDIEVAHMGNDPYFGIPIPEVASDQSSSSDVIHTIVPPDHQVSEHNSKWTKDHPLENIIGNLDRPVSTRLQLHEQALFCYYDAFLTSVEPKNYKDALTQACWIEAMQEELHEFERLLEVWELFHSSLIKSIGHHSKVIYKVTLES
ncbi:hypothetical protein Tco_0215130 [Tanacetum coccineum]